MAFIERNMLTIAIIGVGGYILYRFSRKGGGESAEQQKADVKKTIVELEQTGVIYTKDGEIAWQTMKEIGIPETGGLTLSYPEAWYSQKAAQLYEALFSLNTDEDTIYGVMMGVRNDLDMYKLIESFGSQRPQFTWQYLPLPAFINSKMSNEEIQLINRGLQNTGLAFRF
jgi:hypothetical protein